MYHRQVRRSGTSKYRACCGDARAKSAHVTHASDSEPLRKTVYEQNVTRSPGTGKSHCLSALGLAMCTRSYRVLFTTAAALLMRLIDAKRAGVLERQMRTLDRVDLLLIDELGYIPFEREATDLLFHLISARYERRSVALTTNLPFERWTEIFPDAMAATAVIDRLVHHGSVFAFSGESYRLRTRPRGKSNKVV